MTPQQVSSSLSSTLKNNLLPNYGSYLDIELIVPEGFSEYAASTSNLNNGNEQSPGGTQSKSWYQVHTPTDKGSD